MKNSVAIAMPIYNEADGISESLSMLDEVFCARNFGVVLFIQNDVSTDQTLAKIEELSPRLNMNVFVETNRVNLGHGPTTWAAYQRALASSCAIVVQLDSDGQYDPAQIPKLIETCIENESVVIGVRRFRVDPWYRKVITRALRFYLLFRFQLRCSDPNSPVRVYPARTLEKLLNQVPKNPLIPNIYLSIISSLQEITVTELPIDHRVRRGDISIGTMWSETTKKQRLIPKKLIRFCINSYYEMRFFRKNLKSKSV